MSQAPNVFPIGGSNENPAAIFCGMRPALISLLAAVAMLGSMMQAAGQDNRERFGAPARQNAPLQTYRSTAPMQAPASASPAGTWQSNPAGTQTMHGLQY